MGTIARPFGGRRLGRLWVGVAAVAALAVAQPAAATITPVPVKTTPQDESLPSAGADIGGSGDTYFAWSQNSSGAPAHYDAFFQVNGGGAVKANLDGTSGYAAGVDGTTLVFQEVTAGSHVDSRLIFYDLSTQTRGTAPPGINDSNWQFWPTISGDYVLYGENSAGGNFWRTLLHNTSTGVETVLAHSTYRAETSFPGQVNGDYAAITLVTPKTAQVRVRTISTRTNTFVPNLALRPTYDPAVTADGTVYFARSGIGCGANVRIYRWQLGSTAKPVLLTALPTGMDISARLFAFNDTTSTTLYYDQFNCHTHLSDIYRLDNADTGSLRAPLRLGPGGRAGGMKVWRPVPGSKRSAT